jgi:hypothetical protein
MTTHDFWPPWLKAWLGVLAMAIANGAVRNVVIQPLWGEEVARRVATVLLLVAIGFYVRWFERRHPLPSARRAWQVGVAWTAMTFTFEFGLGLATGLSWTTMLADYDLAAGRIWVLVPLFTAVAPACARNLRLRAARPSRSTSVGPST